MRKSVLLIVLSSAVALVVTTAGPQAQTPLLFETSFDCPDWSQVGLPDPCGPGDGINYYGGWTGSTGRADQITAAANNPLGTGKGLRHYRDDGTNSNGGGLSISFPGTRKLWVRVYMRYSAGFAWGNAYGPHYTKDLYFKNPNAAILGFGGGQLQTYLSPGSQSLSSSDTWTAINGGVVGDGRFHCYEWQIDMGNSSGGIMKIWRDGNLVLSQTGLNTGGNLSEVMDSFVLGSNQNFVVGNHYTDYDDLAISTTGYIGPIGGGSSTSGPSAPTNLRVTS